MRINEYIKLKDMKHNSGKWAKILLSVVTLSQILFLASCAEDSLNWLVGTPINVTATTEQHTTRAGANIQTSNFEEGQTINAYFKINDGDAIGKTPTTLTASAPDGNGKNRLSPDVQPYYPSDDAVDIFALYPPEKATNATTSFMVEDDQQDPSQYKLSDLMWAGITSQAKTTSDVNLDFKHLMAKMSVTVTGKEGVLIKKVKLVNTIRTIPVTELSAAQHILGSVGTESDVTKKTIVLASTTSEELNNQLSGSVLFPPQTINGNFIEVETNYQDVVGYTYYSVVNKEFEGGKAYSADLVVTRQDIGFVTTITDWKDNGGSIAVPPGSSAGLKITAIPNQPYTGSPCTPELNITYTPNDSLIKIMGLDTSVSHTYQLYVNKDYTAQYFNNINQGTAVVIITGQKSPDRTGNYEALADIISQIKSMTSFNITAATGKIEYPSNTKEVEYDYNTTVNHPLNKNDGDGRFTYTSSDPTVADVTVSGIVTIRKVGTTKITAEMDNSGNYSAASDYYDLTVTPRSLKNHYDENNTGDVTVTMSASSFTYMDTDFTPAVVVKDKGRQLQKDKHYTLTYTNNHNVGTATITIRGMGNYSSDDADVITKTFAVNKATPNLQLGNDAVKLAKGHSYTRHATTDYGTITWTSSPAGYVTIENGTVTATNTAANSQPQEVTITASVSAEDNWGAATKSYTLTVVESSWSFVYSSTAQIREWTCPLSGYYELEAMGARGGSTDSFEGGKGADVAGMVYITEGQKLYIYLGQSGGLQSGSDKPTIFNGGGSYTGGTATSATARFTSGGGATDFALKNATWNSEDHLYSRILVAGGGGGALYYKPSGSPISGDGGAGGGEAYEPTSRAEYEGETGLGGNLPGKGGTISAGGAVSNSTSSQAGSFGKGGNYGGSVSGGCGGGTGVPCCQRCGSGHLLGRRAWVRELPPHELSGRKDSELLQAMGASLCRCGSLLTVWHAKHRPLQFQGKHRLPRREQIHLRVQPQALIPSLLR